MSWIISLIFSALILDFVPITSMLIFHTLNFKTIKVRSDSLKHGLNRSILDEVNKEENQMEGSRPKTERIFLQNAGTFSNSSESDKEDE